MTVNLLESAQNAIPLVKLVVVAFMIIVLLVNQTYTSVLRITLVQIVVGMVIIMMVMIGHVKPVMKNAQLVSTKGILFVIHAVEVTSFKMKEEMVQELVIVLV